jgi:hypothetical protein
MINVILEAETKEGLQNAIGFYFSNYHPAGYGTMLQGEMYLENGMWKQKVTRGKSCD